MSRHPPPHLAEVGRPDRLGMSRGMNNMEQRAPELVSPAETPAVRRYLAWHALAAEFMCGIVARGIPLAQTRDQKRALMHQIRTENTQATWLVARVVELGGTVPEQDDALREMQAELVPLCDRSWIDFLACGQVALRGYMGPYLSALSHLTSQDEAYDHFSTDVLIPEIGADFRRALGDLVEAFQSLPADQRQAAFDEARTAETQAFDVFCRFIATSYSMLESSGVDAAQLELEIVEERDKFWQRLATELDLADWLDASPA